MTTFAPYAPPIAPPEKPEKPTAAGRRWNRALAAVLWAMALATVAGARYALTQL
jgi:hypothetical protein